MTEDSRPGYRADIDGLRALAVLAVIGYHAFPGWVRGGFIGVDVFFVISGYLITGLVAGDLEQGRFGWRTFYGRRVRRLFPALLLMLGFCLAVGWFQLTADGYRQLARHTLAGVGFVANLALWREAGYFGTAVNASPLLHLWSLGVEEQFYLLWPLLLVGLHRRGASIASVTLVLGAASFAAGILSLPDHAETAFYSPWTRFWELMLGAWLARAPRAVAELGARWGQALSIAGLSLIALGLALIDPSRDFPGAWALLPTAGTTLLLLAGPRPFLNRVVLSHPLAVRLGRISYPLYLWHWALLALALAANHFVPTSGELRLGLVLASVVLAWITWRWIETPVRRRAAVSVPVLVGLSIALGGCAAAILALDGLPGRAVHRDEAKVFLDHYGSQRLFGMTQVHHNRCDFVDRISSKVKTELHPACTAVTPGGPVFLLWGDSHAVALAHGLRAALAPGVQLAQITASGCPPRLQPAGAGFEPKAACRASQALARDFIVRHRPARVFVVQRGGHEQTDWPALAEFVRAHQGELILIGPVPQWQPSLPVLVARDLKARATHVADGLDPAVFETDRALRRLFPVGGAVRHVSIVAALCGPEGCLARVPTTDPYDLLVLDYGHLTPAGSDHVARTVLGPWLQPPPADAGPAQR